MRNLWLSLLLACLFFSARAQRPASALDSLLTDRFLLDFDVPDMPAFKALGVDPTNILRPGDLKKFAASISPFYSSGQGVIPKNFALEFAPWKLLSRRWSIAKYNTGLNSVLYNSGFSIGTVRDSSSYASKLAIGYRLTIKKGDILKAVHARASALRKKLEETPRRFGALNELRDHWLFDIKGLPRATEVKDILQFIADNKAGFWAFVDSLQSTPIADSSLKRKFDVFAAAFDIHTADDMNTLVTANARPEDFIATEEQKAIDAFNKEMWNADRFDLAVAWVGASKDTLVKSAQFSSLNIWATYAIGVGKQGQVLLGTNVSLPRTERNDTISTNLAFTGNIRAYLGTDKARGFIEGQYKYQNYSGLQRSLLINLGGEFRIGQQFWVVANAGINNYLGVERPLSVLVSSLSVRYGFNSPK